MSATFSARVFVSQRSRLLHGALRGIRRSTVKQRTLGASNWAMGTCAPVLVPWEDVPEEGLRFGKWPIGKGEVFAHTELSFAFVNLKPIVPGHVLVSPKRVADRFGDMTPEEVADMWQLAQRVAITIEPHYGCSSATFAIQDGPAAGQTVPHVHVHVLPRKPGQFEKNDEVYDRIEANESALAQPESLTKGMDADEDRKPRTREEMVAEAGDLRCLFYS